MIKSMTGYGRASVQAHGRTITVDVKSVNHRYFDCTVKLPRVYSFLEDPLKKLAQSSVSRGKLELGVTVDEHDSRDVRVLFNEGVFSAYYDAMKAMCEKYSLRDDISVSAVSRLNIYACFIDELQNRKPPSGCILHTLASVPHKPIFRDKSANGAQQTSLLPEYFPSAAVLSFPHHLLPPARSGC